MLGGTLASMGTTLRLATSLVALCIVLFGTAPDAQPRRRGPARRPVVTQQALRTVLGVVRSLTSPAPQPATQPTSPDASPDVQNVVVAQPVAASTPPLPSSRASAAWYWMYPRAALVAATRPDGRPWDGTGIFLDLVQELHDQLPRVRRRLYNAILPGYGEVLSELVPLAFGFFRELWAAPEVALEVRVNGRSVGGPPVFEDNYNPQWPWNQGLVDPILIPSDAVVEFVAHDRDNTGTELIGGCAMRGVPARDTDNFVPDDAVACHESILAIRVQVRDATPAEVAQWQASITANRRAGLPAHGVADCPPSGPMAGPSAQFPNCPPPRW